MATTTLFWADDATETFNVIAWNPNSLHGTGAGSTPVFSDAVVEQDATLVDNGDIPLTNVYISDFTVYALLHTAKTGFANAYITIITLQAFVEDYQGSAFVSKSMGARMRSQLFSAASAGTTHIIIAGPAPGTFQVSVTGLHGIATYEVIGPPVQLSIDPEEGTTAGGTTVHIFGTGFMNFDENTTTTPGTAVPDVTFDGIPATSVVWISSTEISCVTPAHAAGSVDVVVTNPDGQLCTAPLFYTYVPPIFAMDQYAVELVYAARFTAMDDDGGDGWFPAQPSPGGPPPGTIGGGIRRPFIVNGQWQIHRLDFKPRKEQG